MIIDIAATIAGDVACDAPGIDLAACEFVMRGQPVSIKPETIAEFKKRRLLNSDFFTCGFWVQGVDFSALPERDKHDAR